MTDDPKTPETQATPAAAQRQPIFLLPAVVTALCGVMLAIHLARTFVFNELTDATFVVWFGFVPYRIIDPAALDGGLLPLLWTPVTHAFIHGGWEHVLFNTVWLAIFATPVARRYGTAPLLVIFAASAVVGALFFAATTLPNVAILIGASGGVAGLTGGAARFMFQPVLFARHPETGEPVVLGRKLATLGELARDNRARVFIAMWIIFNAAVPLFPMFLGSDSGIAWQAHLGGFFTGLFLVPLFERKPI
jgi:membrane associated rhomboid family serine protease